MRREVELAMLAVTVASFLAIALWLASFAYGIVHESAHGLVVRLLGGQVYDLYVNPAGFDAYVTHSPFSGFGSVLVNLAGVAATTAVALGFTLAGGRLVPAFFAFRTALYAIDYSPGTDIAQVSEAIGPAALLATLVIVALNVLCLASIANQFKPLRSVRRDSKVPGLGLGLEDTKPQSHQDLDSS